MSFLQIIQSQLVEPFRIVLLIGLVVTMLRTREHTGRLIPLVLGIVFVAVMATMTSEGDRMTLVGAGIVANAILVAIILGAVEAWQRLAKPRP